MVTNGPLKWNFVWNQTSIYPLVYAWNILIPRLQIWRRNWGYSEHIYHLHKLELRPKFFVGECVVLYIHYPMHLLFEQRGNLTFTFAVNKNISTTNSGLRAVSGTPWSFSVRHVNRNWVAHTKVRTYARTYVHKLPPPTFIKPALVTNCPKEYLTIKPLLASFPSYQEKLNYDIIIICAKSTILFLSPKSVWTLCHWKTSKCCNFFVYTNNTAEAPSSEATAPSGARNRLWKNVQTFWHVLRNDGQLLGFFTLIVNE